MLERESLFPTWELIPEQFKRRGVIVNEWVEIAEKWCFTDPDGSFDITTADGIDEATAVAHLRAIAEVDYLSRASKVSAIAFLMSQWFTSITRSEEEGKHA